MRVERYDGERIFEIHDFLTDRECESYVSLAERCGFEEATIDAPGGVLTMKEFRDNARVLRDDPRLAMAWFERARPQLPTTWRREGQAWRLSGLNERFRFYRFDPGERFAPHHDGCVERPDGERSFLTFLVFLNEACVGGETRILRGDGIGRVEAGFTIRPETGKALIFTQDLLHEGAEVLSGRKYVVRSELMYRPERSGGR